MTSELQEPIPWNYTDSPGVLLWTWITDHFVARVTGKEVDNVDDASGRRVIQSYSWDLSDLTRTNQGLPRLLVEGLAASFEDAERSIREHVGKSYDPRLGYRRYSGALAYTFTLTSGEQVDVRELVGTRCSVTVLMPDRSERTVMGDLAVNHYKWRLTASDHVMEIMPEHVVRITNRSEAADRAAAITHSDLYSGIGRIYREDPKSGCTGKPGFMVGTVDHAGSPRCPLHEMGLPDYLLS
jgi:hypothetical protein